ncbi:Transmembrane protease serine 2, partial [Armadillidium vulgare]
CLFKEEGFSLSFVTTPYIHFFIPHNWANDEDNLNHLNIKLFNTNLVLRHPLSSKKESNEINLPLNELNIGWNKIYIRKRRNKVQVVTDNSGSRKVVQNFTLSEDFDSDVDPQATLVTGLYSVGKCLNARRRIYYNIRAKSSFRLPFILYKKANKFVAFSKTNSFNFNVICSGKRQKICKNGKNSIDSFTIRKECEDGSVSFLLLQTLSTMCSFLQKLSTPRYEMNNMNYNYTVFVDLVLENIGNDDFFVEMEVINPSSAPISGLKDNEVTTLSPGIIYETEVKKVCGFNDKKSNVNRIVGGKAADPKDWPWMAALLKIEDLSFFCGGVLITDRYVLTAAHCFQRMLYLFSFYEAKVRLGEYDFGTPNENNVSDFNIERFFYPNYNLVTGDNDIALLKLERPTLFGDFISPVCLSPRFGTFENRLGIVIGWGTQQHWWKFQ